VEWWTKGRRAMSDTDYETWNEQGICPTLNAFDNATETRATVLAGNATCVRRLTPVECERLQGFPDDWTAGLADTNRYKQMGNAVTVNVAHYLGWLLADA
jgi:site-specific DNA-cytosine methylase